MDTSTDIKEHTGQHTDCQPCFKIKLKGVQFAGASERAIGVRAADRQFNEDNAAYRRMRKEGMQPAHVKGSASIERHAEMRREIERGQILTPALRKLAREHGHK